MANTVKCVCNILEEIREFRSILEFERFLKYIADLVSEGDLIEVSVNDFYAGFPEKWYQCSGSRHVWRLVYPDFPFKGLWEKVEK